MIIPESGESIISSKTTGPIRLQGAGCKQPRCTMFIYDQRGCSKSATFPTSGWPSPRIVTNTPTLEFLKNTNTTPLDTFGLFPQRHAHKTRHMFKRMLPDVFYFPFELQAGASCTSLGAVNESLDSRPHMRRNRRLVAGVGSEEGTSRLRTYQKRGSISVPMTNVVVVVAVVSKSIHSSGKYRCEPSGLKVRIQ